MAKGRAYKHNGLEVMVGNTKLGTDTMIFNMGTATDCPSMKRGLCKLGKKCYALKAEKMYPTCKPYRERQAEYWLNTGVDQIWADLEHLLTTKKKHIDGQLKPLADTILWFRYNEAGDFHSQACIMKLNFIAFKLRASFQIETYGYSARADLDFSKASFNVKGSGHDKGNNGRTMAISPKILEAEPSVIIRGVKHISHNDDGWAVCPMECKTCDLCKTSDGVNIVFPLH